MTNPPDEPAPAEETIIAYVDGVLTGAERTAFEARLAEDPLLAERVAAHRWLGEQVIAAYGPPPPVEIVPDLAARFGLLQERPQPTRRLRWLGGGRSRAAWAGAGFALAASLALAIWLGTGHGAADQTIVVRNGGELIATGDLARTLTDAPSGKPGAITVAMTIRTAQGPCRTFHGQTGMSGLACYSRGEWSLPVVAGGAGPEPVGEYRLAGGEVAPVVMAEVDRRIHGDPLAPAEEQAMLRRGWK